MMEDLKQVAVIGGGAAGFFAAIQIREVFPKAKIFIFEKSAKPLAKVKISGGGRCNVTNGCNRISELVKAYPRGGKKLKKIFKVFNTVDTQHWFEQRGVRLYEQDDGRVFPVSDDSQTIIDCLYREIRQKNIQLVLRTPLKSLKPAGNGWLLDFGADKKQVDKVVLALGGLSKPLHWQWAEQLSLKVQPPVPSLFTFNMPGNPVCKLMGVSVPAVQVVIPGTRLKESGPLLITHWGMSGPAILKLSAFGARLLAEKNYQFEVLINWANENNAEKVAEELEAIIMENGRKKVQNIKPFGLPERLWNFLLERAELDLSRTWDELGKRKINKLVHILTNDSYTISGKTTFKEEFVTCGGIDLDTINLLTMESVQHPGLFFAGEILDIDGVTGGYNFQAAWTTGFIAGHLGKQTVHT